MTDTLPTEPQPEPVNFLNATEAEQLGVAEPVEPQPYIPPLGEPEPEVVPEEAAEEPLVTEEGYLNPDSFGFHEGEPGFVYQYQSAGGPPTEDENRRH